MEKDRFEFDEKEVLEEENEDRDYVGEIVRLIRSELSEEELLEKLEDYHENDIAGAFEQLEAKNAKSYINFSDRKKYLRYLLLLMT